jgi:hypothetical protein
MLNRDRELLREGVALSTDRDWKNLGNGAELLWIGNQLDPPSEIIESRPRYHLQRFAPTCNGLQRQMAPLLICRAVIKDRRSSLRRHSRRLSGPFPVTRVARKQTYDRNFNMPSD